MLDIVKEWVPFAYEAFMEYKVNSAAFSGNGVKAIKAMLQGEKVTAETSGMSKREWLEFAATLGINP
jgi:thymidylate synthase (FAD)